MLVQGFYLFHLFKNVLLWIVLLIFTSHCYPFECMPHFKTIIRTNCNFPYYIPQAVTVNTNAWTNAGHAVNQVYDILYMMDRDDIAVGVGGEGGILEDGTIQPDVGGYLPIIDQVQRIIPLSSLHLIKNNFTAANMDKLKNLDISVSFSSIS